MSVEFLLQKQQSLNTLLYELYLVVGERPRHFHLRYLQYHGNGVGFGRNI